MADSKTPSFDNFSCPLPLPHDQKISISHGSGGRMTHDLVQRIFLPHFGEQDIEQLNDAARFTTDQNRIAISTDCHVVSPLFFPGGDIGRLAVAGTVNDVAMVGAKPRYLTAGFIIEEGLDFETLDRIAASMQSTAEEAGIKIIAGDTKVVQRGHADQLYISTSGFGTIPEGINISGNRANPGDLVILSGTIGDHGIAVLSARGELGVELSVKSDVAPVSNLVQEMVKFTNEIHVLRDPTRGGVATTLNEIARQSNVCITINENTIPVKPPVRTACDMFGFDPLYMANEGKLIAIVPPSSATDLIGIMKNHELGKDSVVIGEVQVSPKSKVLMKTVLGATHMLDMLSGELLPRIC